MLRESVFALAAVFAVCTTFFFMIPVYSAFQTPLVNMATGTPGHPGVVTDPTFLSTLSYLPQNLFIIIQYSFVAVLIGLGIYLILIPFRDEYTSGRGFG